MLRNNPSADTRHTSTKYFIELAGVSIHEFMIISFHELLDINTDKISASV